MPRCVAERTCLRSLCEPVRDQAGESLRRRVQAGETRLVVEVAVVEFRQHGTQLLARSADVDDDTVCIELGAAERRFDELPDVMARLAAGSLPGLCHTITYGEG